MLFSLVSAALMSLLTVVLAQTPTPASGSYSYTIPANDPSASPQLRNSWCVAQQNSCRQVCGGSAPQDQCNAQTLTYTCVCGDGSTPDLTQYNQTLPFFECQQYQQECLAANPTNAQAQQSCLAVPCGGKDPAAAESSASLASASSMSSASATASSTGGSSSSSSGSGSSSSSAAPASAAHVQRSFDPYLTISALVVGFMVVGGMAL